MDISERLKIAQQLAYLNAGGGQKGAGDNILDFITGVGQAGLTLQEMKKKNYEAQKLKQEVTPISESYSAPKTKASLDAVFSQNIPAQDLISGKLDTVGQGIEQAKQGALSDQAKYGTLTPEQFQKKATGDALLAKQDENDTQLYLDKTNGSVEVIPNDNTVPFVKVTKKEAADIIAKKANTATLTNAKNDLTGLATRAAAVRTAQNNADKATGKITYADVRLPAFINAELPSNQSPSTAAGAASQVQLAVRQGKSLIAKPGSPQQIALASSDLARAVQRSAPQLETLNGASFASNFITKISALSQKITADPTAKDVPKLRKQIYDILDELDKSSNPIIERQLKTVESLYKDKLPQNWKEIRDQQLGGGMPDIPFQETASTELPSGGIPGQTKSGMKFKVIP